MKAVVAECLLDVSGGPFNTCVLSDSGTNTWTHKHSPITSLLPMRLVSSSLIYPLMPSTSHYAFHISFIFMCIHSLSSNSHLVDMHLLGASCVPSTVLDSEDARMKERRHNPTTQKAMKIPHLIQLIHSNGRRPTINTEEGKQEK